MTEENATIEQTNSQDLLVSFKQRYESLIAENQQLAAKIKENEATALKLLGGIETLEYINKENNAEEEAE